MLGKLLRGLRGRTESARPVHQAVVPAEPVAAVRTAPEESASLPGLPFMIRPLERQDLAQLSQVFTNAIHELAARDYDEEQRRAWARKSENPEFLAQLLEGTTIIAEHHGEAVAFAQLLPVSHLRMLYVHPEWASLGIATLMYQYLEDEARILGADHLDAQASHTAKRFFESVGFKAQQEETVEVDGIQLARHLMYKKL